MLAMSKPSSSHLSFDMGVPIATRVATISPIINAMIEEHDNEANSFGVDAFQEDVVARIKAAGLMATT